MTTTNTTAIKSRRTIVTRQSLAAGGTVRGTLDMRTSLSNGAMLTILNGATGPTAQCRCIVSVSTDPGPTPAPGPVGAVWKRHWEFGGGTAANAHTEHAFTFEPWMLHAQIEFTGNAGQAVTVEADGGEITNARTQP